MPEINQNFEMYQRETRNIIVSNNVDLTGSTVTWALRQRMTSTANLITKTTPGQITINGNTCTIQLLPADTASLKGNYYHECKMVDSQGDVSELFTGNATILISNL